PELTRGKTCAEWAEGLARLGVPSSPVNDIAQVFEDPQVQAREMKLTMPLAAVQGGQVDLIANPIKYSKTPVTYRTPPPGMGEHTEDVLEELLGLEPAEIADLKGRGVV
ncbi:MAG: CoA transferase, partial [Rhodospirillales bacterium]|nr:CoA transferase [Rhodospirillales bacterium]